MRNQLDAPAEEDRREFIRKCGRFAAITPPALSLLLSTSLSSDALAKSGGRHGHFKRRKKRHKLHCKPHIKPHIW